MRGTVIEAAILLSPLEPDKRHRRDAAVKDVGITQLVKDLPGRKEADKPAPSAQQLEERAPLFERIGDLEAQGPERAVELENNGQISALREEVARMNRLVEQLLCVARLDSLALDVSSPVDLHQLAEEVVGSMAHLAVSDCRTIALTGSDHPVLVTGNAAAIADALRNLIENAPPIRPQAPK